MGLLAASPCVTAKVQHTPLYLAIRKFIFTTGFGVCGEATSSKSPFIGTGVMSVILLEAYVNIWGAPKLLSIGEGCKAISS